MESETNYTLPLDVNIVIEDLVDKLQNASSLLVCEGIEKLGSAKSAKELKIIGCDIVLEAEMQNIIGGYIDFIIVGRKNLIKYVNKVIDKRNSELLEIQKEEEYDTVDNYIYD